MYSEKVMDHFSNPRNVGEIENGWRSGDERPCLIMVLREAARQKYIWN